MYLLRVLRNSELRDLHTGTRDEFRFEKKREL